MNKTSYLYILIIIIMFSSLTFGQDLIRLDGLVRPESLTVDANNIYISDGATVKIYSRKDYKFVAGFGKRGNGPQEFALFNDRGIRIYLVDDKILVNSVMKLSFWTKKGEFIKSIKPEKFSALYIPTGENYVGSGRAVNEKIRYKTVNLYNPKLEPFKELIRSRESFQPGKGLSIGGENTNYYFEVGDKKIFCCNSNDFEIDVFNDKGEKIKHIKLDYMRKKISAQFRKDVIHYLKTDPKFKEIYEMLKPVTFADYFPAIDGLKYNDGKLYVIAGSTDERQEIVVLKTDGTLIKKLKIPMRYKNAIKLLYPYVIEGGKLFQLVENSDEEEWDLIVFDLK